MTALVTPVAILRLPDQHTDQKPAAGKIKVVAKEAEQQAAGLFENADQDVRSLIEGLDVRGDVGLRHGLGGAFSMKLASGSAIQFAHRSEASSIVIVRRMYFSPSTQIFRLGNFDWGMVRIPLAAVSPIWSPAGGRRAFCAGR